MRDDIDIDTSPILEGEKTAKDMGNTIIETILRVANGEETCSEKLGHAEINIHESF